VAEFAGAFASSHAPLLARDWHLLGEPLRERLSADFRELGRRLLAARPDVIVAIAPDHWTNFFLDNLPSVCIGVGDTHAGPPEPFLRDFPHAAIPGDPDFGRHLVRTALESGFEPSVSHHARLDHGFCLPLLRMELELLPRIVPVFLNSLEPPMPAIRRCLAWGEMLAQAIASFPDARRVAVFASGGLSHSIGEPAMGSIDEAFDRACVAAFAAGDPERLATLIDAGVEAAGNGSHEIRNWLVAHGAARNSGFDLIDYLPVDEVYVGCGFASWQAGSEAPGNPPIPE
jgi:aromatic ring-opening dioxygenase catalytic subunit (LigB family)